MACSQKVALPEAFSCPPPSPTAFGSPYNHLFPPSPPSEEKGCPKQTGTAIRAGESLGEIAMNFALLIWEWEGGCQGINNLLGSLFSPPSPHSPSGVSVNKPCLYWGFALL